MNGIIHYNDVSYNVYVVSVSYGRCKEERTFAMTIIKNLPFLHLQQVEK